MDRRSTNEIGYTHFWGDVTAQIGSSHGVRLTGGSTGGIVEAVGDDTNVSLTIRGQGAGRVFMGSSQVGVTANGVVIGNNSSNSTIAGMQIYTVQYAVPTQAANILTDSTVTVAGLTTGAVLTFTPQLSNLSTVNVAIVQARCSTAAELTLVWCNPTATTITGGSTHRGRLLETRFA